MTRQPPHSDGATLGPAAEEPDPSGDGLHRYVELASGLTRATLHTTERVLAQFVRQGEVAADHAERLLDEVVARSVEGSGALARLVRSEVERAVARAGFVRSEELRTLRHDVDRLREQVDAVAGSAARSPRVPREAPPDAAREPAAGLADPSVVLPSPQGGDAT